MTFPGALEKKTKNTRWLWVKILAKDLQKQLEACHVITSIKEYVYKVNLMGSPIRTYMCLLLCQQREKFPHPEVDGKNKSRKKTKNTRWA